MTEKRTISAVTEFTSPNGWLWWHIIQDIDSTNPGLDRYPPPPPGGYKHVLSMPQATLEIRAAEYGMDPHDVEAILDVVLHERHIPDPTHSRYRAADAAANRGMVRGGHPVTLHNSSSKAEALRAHLIRVEEVKMRLTILEAPSRPLDPVRNAYVAGPEHINRVARALHEGDTAFLDKLMRRDP